MLATEDGLLKIFKFVEELLFSVLLPCSTLALDIGISCLIVSLDRELSSRLLFTLSTIWVGSLMLPTMPVSMTSFE